MEKLFSTPALCRFLVEKACCSGCGKVKFVSIYISDLEPAWAMAAEPCIILLAFECKTIKYYLQSHSSSFTSIYLAYKCDKTLGLQI